MPSSLLRHRPHRAWSGTGTFYAGEVSIPCGGWCNGADFTEISKFPEILGMREQCVPGSFLSAHALEPGNEANQNANQKPIRSVPAYWAQCTLPPQPIYQTLLLDFSRVWFRDYLKLVGKASTTSVYQQSSSCLLLRCPACLKFE